MARKLILENLMKLAQSIGANPKNFMGTRTNITFLGKGPQRNPLFQSPVPGLETASEASLGPRESIIGAVEDAMGFASAGKLNDIQLQALTLNLKNIYKVYNPPVLPMASVTDIAPGIAGLKRFPRETQKFFGRPLKSKDFSEIDRMVMEGKIPDARGRTWNLGAPGPGNLQGALDAKTGMSRAIARQLLQQDTRLKLTPEELFMLKEGKGEPLELMRKYYGRSMMNFDDFMSEAFPGGSMVDAASLKAWNPKDVATRILSDIELIPQFAEGGLAGILQAPRKNYARGGWSPGVGRDERGYQSTHPSYGGGGGDGATIETPVIDRSNVNVEPIQTFKRDSNYLDKIGLGISRNRAHALGLLRIGDLAEGDIKPDLYAGYSGNNFNIAGQKTQDQKRLDASAVFGPANIQASYQDVDGNINKNIGASYTLGNNFQLGANYNPDGGLTYGGTYNRGNVSGGVNFVDGKPQGMLKYSLKYNKGGLAGILEV